MTVKSLIKEYDKRKKEIRDRLKLFRSVGEEPDRRIFSELCFCICTPQSSAVNCDRAISYLKKNGDLFTGDIKTVRKGLKAVRFPNNKSKYIIAARDMFTRNGRISIKDAIDEEDVFASRLWLEKNVKGLGLKEASHFLRNIGLGEQLAILDVHILRNMARLKLIDEIPKSISKKTYFELEDRLKRFSKKIDITMGELDLLFWSQATGFIFK